MDDAVRDLLARSAALAGDPAGVALSARLFDYVQFLLDDDANLTPAGNLNGEAKEKLRKRLVELLDAGDAPEEQP